MREIVKQTIEKFSSHELPKDPAFYQTRRQHVSQLVEAIRFSTKRHISWEAPIDLFNFYHLQISVDQNLEIPLYDITIDLLEGLVAENRSTSFLHFLTSNFGSFIFFYGIRFLPFDFQESVFTESSFQDPLEENLFKLVQKDAENKGWIFLTSPEANEVVPNLISPWPSREKEVLVKHVLFPGCGDLFDD